MWEEGYIGKQSQATKRYINTKQKFHLTGTLSTTAHQIVTNLILRFRDDCYENRLKDIATVIASGLDKTAFSQEKSQRGSPK